MAEAAMPGPASPQARLAAAAALHDAGRLPEAEKALRSLLADPLGTGGPRPVPVLIRLAGVLLDMGEVERAYAVVDEAAASEPTNPLALNLRGTALVRLGRRREAEAALRAAIAVEPEMVEAHFNLGNLLAGEARMAEAAVAFRVALDLAPRFTAARRALSAALRDDGRFAQALAEIDRVIADEGRSPELLNERGIVLIALRRAEEAVAAFDAAIAANPDFTAPQFNRSIALLHLGDYRRGWAAYENRFRTAMVRQMPFERPRWTGAEPIEGRTIVLWGEQGHGDTLQFVRYATLVAGRGARVVVLCQTGLAPLLASVPGVDAAVPVGASVGPHDFHAPLMSLPAIFGTTPQTIPAAVPYLAPDAATRARWAGRLPDSGRLRVGLAWAGEARAHMPQSHATDRRRSLRLDWLAPLFDVPGVDLVSLQFGRRAAERQQVAFGERLIDPMADVRSFADTAALMEQLDLVISVDTAVVHLAGALGRPTWMLSRWDGCFRWFIDRDDSPWYPTLRLFRQPAPGDWAPAIARVAEALRERAAAR
ncbi:MAG: tetratricopeptide repeat protein [Alphaproteobacteria bacterium]